MSPDRMGPVDHGSVLSRLRDFLVQAYGDTEPALWPLQVREFVDTLEGGDALLVQVRPVPLADDELRALGSILGPNIAVVRLPEPDEVDDLWDVETDRVFCGASVRWLSPSRARTHAAYILAACAELEPDS